MKNPIMKSGQPIITKMTPILILDSIEDNLPLWTQHLGYTVEAEVPHDGKIGFVILKQGSSEVMLQTRASLGDDLPVLEKAGSPQSVLLYADVSGLDDLISGMDGVEVIVPKRRTFYGADEVWVRTRPGQIIGFAEFAAK